MKYVDGFVLAVKKRMLKDYIKMANVAAKIWKDHGALEYFETVGDDLTSKWAGIKFNQMVKAKPNETVVFSFIVYKSKSHRDKVNDKVMNDPRMNDPKYKDKPMPFDMKRMAYGGFNVIVEK